MKTKYKYISFEKIEDKPKTSVWVCFSKNNYPLGKIKWYQTWRQYCFLPNDLIVLSRGYLDDISDFIKQLKEL